MPVTLPEAVPDAPAPLRARHRMEHAALRLVDCCVRLLPVPAVRACGRGLGRVAYAVSRRHRRIALDNLAHAFPDWPAGARRRVARATFGHFGGLLLELLKFSSLSHDRMLGLVDVEGEEHVRTAHRQGRGILFVTGHFGCWEMQAIVHALRVAPVSVLARRLDNPLLHAWLERIRTQTGNRVIYRQGALRRVLRDLAANRGVALLIDQHLLTSDAVSVDFFGRPAATTTALAALALRTGAPVIPVFALPLPRGRYRFVFEPPVEPPPNGSPDPIGELTQRCTVVLERYVARHPQMWLWMHRRWR